MVAAKPEILVIVGPTASGKSDLAIKIAKQFNGEIISADSLTVYKHMDIGTAKPTADEQEGITHWGFDLAGPGWRFTAADFKQYAQAKIKDIQKKGKLPIVAGGTGLYVDALVFNFAFGGPAKPLERQKLEKLSIEQLQAKIKLKGFKMPQNSQNKRHLIRTLERNGNLGSKDALPDGVLIIGIMPETEVLKARIAKRADKMFDAGLVEETQKLIIEYGKNSMLAKAKVAYGPVIEYLDGDISLEEAKAKLITAHWQFARRQRTWFKRNSEIQWFGSADEAYEYVAGLLNT